MSESFFPSKNVKHLLVLPTETSPCIICEALQVADLKKEMTSEHLGDSAERFSDFFDAILTKKKKQWMKHRGTSQQVDKPLLCCT